MNYWRNMRKKFEFERNELSHIVNLVRELSRAEERLASEKKLTRYTGARMLLTSSLIKYRELPEEVRELLHVDQGYLERKSVETLVEDGYRDSVSAELLDKYHSIFPHVLV